VKKKNKEKKSVKKKAGKGYYSETYSIGVPVLRKYPRGISNKTKKGRS